MNFLWTTLHVSQLEASLAFYRDRLGLSLNRQIEPAKIVFLGSGQTLLELIEGEATPSETISLGFSVKNLEDWTGPLHDCLVSDIISPMPGFRFCFVADPDGYRIQLVEMGQHD